MSWQALHMPRGAAGVASSGRGRDKECSPAWEGHWCWESLSLSGSLAITVLGLELSDKHPTSRSGHSQRALLLPQF